MESISCPPGLATSQRNSVAARAVPEKEYTSGAEINPCRTWRRVTADTANDVRLACTTLEGRDDSAAARGKHGKGRGDGRVNARAKCVETGFPGGRWF